MKGTPPTQTAHAATHRTVCYVHLYEEHLHLIGRLARPPLPAPRTRFRPFQRNQRPPPRAPLPRRPQQTLSRRAPRDNARDAPPHGAGARSIFPPPPPVRLAPALRTANAGHGSRGRRGSAGGCAQRSAAHASAAADRPMAAARGRGRRGARRTGHAWRKKKKRLRGRQKTSPAPRAALCSRGAQGTCEGHSGPLFPPVSKLAPPPLAVQCRIRLESRAAGVCPLRRQAPLGGAPLPLAQRRHPPHRHPPSRWRAQTKQGVKLGGGTGEACRSPPCAPLPPTRPSRPPPPDRPLGRVRALPRPTRRSPPVPSPPPRTRHNRASVRRGGGCVPSASPPSPCGLRGRVAPCGGLFAPVSLSPSRGGAFDFPPRRPCLFVCARAGGRSSLRGAVGAVAAFYLFLASSYCGPLRLAPGRAPWRPPPCAT